MAGEFRGAEPPPPPVFTLEGRGEFSPNSSIEDYPLSLEFKLETRTPVRDSLYTLKRKSEVSTFYPVSGGPHPQQGTAILSWWSSGNNGGDDEKGNDSPVNGMVQNATLFTFLSPNEVARLDLRRNNLHVGNQDVDMWVTIYEGCLTSDIIARCCLSMLKPKLNDVEGESWESFTSLSILLEYQH